MSVVDARGLRCPLPVLRLARAAQHAAVGTELELVATDPAAVPDVKAWARMRGHEFLGSEPYADDDGDRQAAVVVKVRVVRLT